jgi:chromosomal replication initiator protein
MSTLEAQPLAETSPWNAVKSDLQSLFPHDVYATWFAPIDCLDHNEHALVLSVPNDFAAIWIQDNYADLITQKVQQITGQAVHVHFKVDSASHNASETHQATGHEGQAWSRGEGRLGTGSSSSGSAPKASAASSASRPATPAHMLNPKNTFANFVVGSGSQLPHAACIAVANAPGRAYNPLFLYGDTGLGKTHLMHAVAHHILATQPNAYVVYVSTEKFTNEFIRAIQENTLIKFRQRYRSVDALLIDDIHFLSGKERIQEEFFHTFNELFECGKQIFLCSDRPASEIAKLESRLVSRFQWGLVSDIQPPDLETRMAILSKKAQAMRLELDDKVLQFLAERVLRNVRRMEGALTRVASYLALTPGGKLDIPQVERLLQDILQEEVQNQLTIEKIQTRICEHYQVRLQDVLSKKRPANIAFPRQVAMYLCRTLTHHSLQEIGSAFGGRDHGTVIHACKTVENTMEQDESVRRAVLFLQQQFGAR